MTSSREEEGLKLLFKVGYMLLSMTPMLPVDDGSDAGHTNVAIFITILQLLLLLGIETKQPREQGQSSSSKSKVHFEENVGNEGSSHIKNKKAA